MGKTGVVDIVAKDAEGNIIVAMCSYSKKMTFEDYEWLKFQLKKAMIKTDNILLFGEMGFDEKLIAEASDGKIKLHHIITD